VSEELRNDESGAKAKTLADDMRRRLVRCAELSAFAIWLRRQTAEKKENEHGR